jgi:hypothetical protein
MRIWFGTPKKDNIERGVAGSKIIIYRILTLPVVLYGYGTWSVTTEEKT